MLFNASVEPIPQYLETMQEVYDKKIYKRLKTKFDALNAHLLKLWSLKADLIKNLLTKNEGGLKANIMVDKFGLFRDVKEFAADLQARLISEGGASPNPGPLAHILNQGDTDGVFLPFKFTNPMQLKIPGRAHSFPVSSSVILEQELQLLNQHLKVERTFKIIHLPEFIEATSKQIEMFEKEHAVDPSFWIKFGFVVLRTLNLTARENKLPIIFHYL